MKKIIIVLIIVTINLAILNSQQWESVLELSFGSSKQQVGIEEWPTGYSSVTNMAFDKNDNLYLADERNDRILVFNKNFKYVKEITSKSSYLSSTRRMLIDKNLNIWVLFNSCVFKIDNNGKLLIDTTEAEKMLPYLPDYWYKMHLYESKLFVKNRDGVFFGIDDTGKKFDIEKVEKYRDNLLAEQRHNNLSRSNTDINFDDVKNNVKGKISSFIDENGRIFSTDKNEYIKYAKELRKVARDKKVPDSRSNKPIEFNEEPFGFNEGEIVIKEWKNEWYWFATDKNQNSYWRHESGVVKVFDKFGQRIKEISLVELYKKSNVDTLRTLTIDQKGNIYYAWMHSDVGFRLYQYKRTW